MKQSFLMFARTMVSGSVLGLLPACGGGTAEAGPPVAIKAAAPNAVSVWDEMATTAITTPAAASGTAEERLPIFGVDHATVHLAIYDALAAITGKYQPYAVRPTTSAAGASEEAAANTAAYEVMKGLFPARVSQYQATYDARIAAVPDGDAKTRGMAVGAEVARGMLALRANDGRLTPLAPYVHGTTPGKFRAGAAIGRINAYIKPFAMTSAAQFRADGPPALDSAAYAADLNESKSYGRATGSARTEAQTEAARFHTDPPPFYWTRNLRQFGTSQPTLADNSRLMAMLWVAHSDGTIACFDSKYTYNAWRPTTAIQLADSATNPATAAEADWAPLMPTPPHPEYPAAHSCVTGAVAQTLRNYFRTNQVSVTYTSGVANTVAHNYATTEDMLADVAGARIYGGMHFRTSTVDGEKLGSKVANQVAENFFKPAN